jgi:hypothetical protein
MPDHWLPDEVFQPDDYTPPDASLSGRKSRPHRQPKNLQGFLFDAETASSTPSDIAQTLHGLASLSKLKAGLSKVEERLVRRARSSGASWQKIGDAAGMSRQAAHERWSHLLDHSRRR